MKKRDVKLDKVIYLPNGIAEMEIEYNNDIDVTLKKYGNKKKIIYTGAHGQANDLMRILELAYKMKNNSEIVFTFCFTLVNTHFNKISSIHFRKQ